MALFATAMRAVHALQNAADLLPTSPFGAVQPLMNCWLTNWRRMVRHSAAEATLAAFIAAMAISPASLREPSV